MGMLLRTKSLKVALGLKIVCISTISLTYLLIAVFSSGKIDRIDVNNNIDIQSGFNGRHLLAVNLLNESSSSSTHSPKSYTPSPISLADILYSKTQNVTTKPEPRNCTPAAIHEFPPDGLTREQRQHGYVLIHVVLVCYLFIFLAVVCDDYFVPCIKKLCDALHMREDVAGATLMASASSSAEIFINTIGTFITQGDIGVGTIVGSAVFNILAVPACCGLFANMVLDLEWYPVTRDSLIYGCSVILLIVFLQDGKIFYYEALTLVLLYTCYVLIMVFNNGLSSWFHKTAARINRKGYYKEVLSESHPLLTNPNGKLNNYSNGIHDILDNELTLKDLEELEESTNIWEWPSKDTKIGKSWWTLTWPISFILYLSTPNPRIYPKLSVITFFMCVFWIGSISYIVAWLITVIGDTLEIPDSVMGLTFLAAGTSVPEAVSSVLVTNQGHGSMGISSSIGSNTFDILLCLGIPWFIKSAFYPKVPGEHWITINSQGINYSAGCLLTTLVLLYLSIYINKFKLDWKIGLTCLMMYVGFLVIASLVELNVFFLVNVPTCDR